MLAGDGENTASFSHRQRLLSKNRCSQEAGEDSETLAVVVAAAAEKELADEVLTVTS